MTISPVTFALLRVQYLEQFQLEFLGEISSLEILASFDWEVILLETLSFLRLAMF